MKRILTIIIVLTFSNLFSQEKILYEQIALQYYSQKIKKESNKTVTIYPETLNGRWFFNSECLKEEFGFRIHDTLYSKPVNGFDVKLNLEFDKNLKPGNVLESKLLVVPATKFKNSILVAIVEKNFAKTIGYYILFDENGTIIKWCKSKFDYNKGRY